MTEAALIEGALQNQTLQQIKQQNGHHRAKPGSRNGTQLAYTSSNLGLQPAIRSAIVQHCFTTSSKQLLPRRHIPVHTKGTGTKNSKSMQKSCSRCVGKRNQTRILVDQGYCTMVKRWRSSTLCQCHLYLIFFHGKHNDTSTKDEG